MSNRENLLNWFIRGTFFSKQFPVDSTNPKCEPCRLSIENKDNVRLAVNKAYLDMTPRTIRTQEDKEKQSIDQTKKDIVLNNFAEEIKKYIMGRNYSDFDNQHKRISENFREKFNEVLAASNHIEIKYGKAQKIVNMTFKYLYCFDDAEDYIEFFEKCHMAIDSYIIEWYNNNVAKSENVNKIKEVWSNLTYDDYNSIQDNIKKYISDNKDYGETPFYAEFIIWQEEKAKAVKKK